MNFSSFSINNWFCLYSVHRLDEMETLQLFQDIFGVYRLLNYELAETFIFVNNYLDRIMKLIFSFQLKESRQIFYFFLISVVLSIFNCLIRLISGAEVKQLNVLSDRFCSKLNWKRAIIFFT